MNYQEIERLYRQGKQVPKCYLLPNGRLRSRHEFIDGVPWFTPPIRQDTPYFYPEEEPVEEYAPDYQELNRVKAELAFLRNRLNEHMDKPDTKTKYL